MTPDDTTPRRAGRVRPEHTGYDADHPDDDGHATVVQLRTDPPQDDAAPADANQLHEGSSWAEVDFAAVLDTDRPPVVPTVLAIDTLPRRHLFYPAAVNGIHGDSGIGKSWVATLALAEEMKAGRNVMLIDYEDGPYTLKERLLALAAPRDAIAAHLSYRRPNEEQVDATTAHLCQVIRDRAISLVVIDSLGEAFGVEGIDENADSEVGPYLREKVRPLADAGAAVVIIDHSTKSKDNPLFPSGSKRKRAAMTGSSFYVTAVAPPSRSDGLTTSSGRLELTCAKDRHGHYRQGQKVAAVTIDSHPDGGVAAHVWPVTEQGVTEAATIRAARKAVDAAESAGVPLTKNALGGLMKGVRKQDQAAGIDYAVANGYLTAAPGPNRSVLHTFTAPMPD